MSKVSKIPYLELHSNDNSMKYYETALQQDFRRVVLTFTQVARVSMVLAHKLVQLGPCACNTTGSTSLAAIQVHSSFIYAGSSDSKQFQIIPKNSKEFQTCHGLLTWRIAV